MILPTRVVELLRNGEGLSVEFKRCSGRIVNDRFGVSHVFDCNRINVDIRDAFDCSLWYNAR